MLTSIIAAAGIFAVLIIVHEAGHFMMAKSLGVRVLRFSIGYPPRIFGVRHGETEYAIGALPLGGYVKMLGDEIADEPSADTIRSYLRELELDLQNAARKSGALTSKLKPEEAVAEIVKRLEAPGDDPADSERAATPVLGRELKPEEALLVREIRRLGSEKRAVDLLSESRPSALLERFNLQAFPSQSLRKRVAIVLAGPLANIIFAPILMTLTFMYGVPTVLPVLGQVKPKMPAAAAGLETGDRVLAVGSHLIHSWEELSDLVKGSGGQPLKLTVSRPLGKTFTTLTMTIKPTLLKTETVYGNQEPSWIIGVMPRGDVSVMRFRPRSAITSGFTETVKMAGTLIVGIAKIVDGATPARQALGGPIMIAEMAGKEAHEGFADLMIFTVMLSLELGIINLLPVPLLDGGHLAFFVAEAARGKPLKLRHREIAMQVGLFLLFCLMVFVILNDISRIIG